MTGPELKALRQEMHMDMRSMSLILDKMPYRTYQDYEYGKRGIPESVAERVREAHRKDREFMAGIVARVDEEINRQFPMGIPSEISLQDESWQ